MRKHFTNHHWLSLFLIFVTSCNEPENTEVNDQLLLAGGRKNELANTTCLLDITCSQLEQWKLLAQHKPETSVMNKIKAIDEAYGSFGDMEIQSIENAKGPIVNMDYFTITIQLLPLDPVNHWRFSADEFLDHIRRNLNNFVDAEVSSFSASQVTGLDEDLIWNSSDPLGAVLHLDKKAGHGSVICSSHSRSQWIFTTIEVPYNPFFHGYDGEHAVSGNRAFGYTRNSDGSFTFYTRGVDRITDYVDGKIVSNLKDDPFDALNILWTGFMNHIYNFTITNGGLATPLQPLTKTYKI